MPRCLFAFVCLALLLVAPLAAAERPAVSPELERFAAGEAPKTPADLRLMEAHVQKLVEYVTPCVVGISLGGSQGSGVVISKDGYVLTAGHVASAPDRTVTIHFADGRTAKGKTLGINHGIDSGLVKITDTGEWTHLEMGDSKALKPGAWCLGLGHPGGFQPDRAPVLRLGRVLNNRRQTLVTDCALVGGDSGGPLFDLHGNVIGIHSRIGGALTSNIHVPVDTYRETWDRLVKAEAWGFIGGNGPFFGVVADDAAENAKIREVFPGSPAEKAGIKPGDVIVKFGDKAIADFPALVEQVSRKQPGDKVNIEVRRGEKSVTLEVTLTKRQ